MATYNKELLSAGMLGIISAIIALPGLVGPFIVTRVGQQKIITLSRYLILFISIPVVLIRVPVFFAHEFGNIDP